MSKLLLLLSTLFLMACSTMEELPTAPPSEPEPAFTPKKMTEITNDETFKACKDAFKTDLIVNKSEDAGNVRVFLNGGKLIIRVRSVDWSLSEVKMHIGLGDPENPEYPENPAEVFPLNGPGNVKLGHFMFIGDAKPNKKVNCYSLTAEDLGWDFTEGDVILMSLHAELTERDDPDSEEQGAWAGSLENGIYFGGKSRGMYVRAILKSCESEDID